MTLVADASSVLAILLGEPDADVYLSKLVAARKCLISPVNWWEVMVTMNSRYGEPGAQAAAEWMERAGIRVEPAGQDQARAAFSAFTRFGGRPARLNLGDCFAYALAQASHAPLLFKGRDFERTDIKSA